MRESERRLNLAKARSIKARARLTGTLIEMQTRLRPAALIEDAVDELKEKAGDKARETLAYMKARPATTAGIVAAVLIYMFRGRLIEALLSVFSSSRETTGKVTEFDDRSGAAFPPANMEKER